MHEESRVRTAVQSQEAKVGRLKGVMEIVGRVKEIEREMVGLLGAAGGEQLGAKVLLEPFADEFDELFGKFPEEYLEMQLDEVVVGAVAPIVSRGRFPLLPHTRAELTHPSRGSQCRRLFQDWDPLSSPDFAVPELKRWRKHFLIDKDVIKQDNGMDVDVFGSASYSNGGSSQRAADRSMTAYESMMWTVWLPRVRSAIK